jgi:hypothetical protein
MTADDLFRNTALHRDWMRGVFRRARWVVLGGAALTVFLELVRPTRSTWQDTFIYLAFPAWFLTILFSVAWPPRARARREGSALVLRLTPGWRYGLRAALVLPAAGFTLAFLPKGLNEPVAVSVLAVFVAVMSFAVLAFREKIHVTTAGVERASPWTGRTRTLRWLDVTKVELDGFRRLIMWGPQAATIKVSLLLEGAGDFAAQALSSLPAHVVDAGTNVRCALEVVARRLEGAAREELSGRSRALRLPLVVLAAVLLAAGVGAWAFSMRLETPLRVPIPDGWVDLSPGVPEASFSAFPPTLREEARAHGVVAFAAERATGPSGEVDQAMTVRLTSGEMSGSSLERTFAGALAAAIPGARVVSEGVEIIQGVRCVRAELSSGEDTVIAYAAPVMAQTAVAVFSCAAAECGRVRETAAATMRAIEGLAEPASRSRYLAPLVRAGGVLAVFAAILVGLVVLEETHRERRSREMQGMLPAA